MLELPTNKWPAAAKSQEIIDVFGAPLFVLSDGAATPIVLGEQHVPPGYGVPLHVHDVDDELFLVLEGELTLAGPDGETVAGPGACIPLPRGVPHGFRNATARPARMLVALTPGIQALEMFRQFDRAGRARPLQPTDIVSIAGQYGVRFP